MAVPIGRAFGLAYGLDHIGMEGSALTATIIGGSTGIAAMLLSRWSRCHVTVGALVASSEERRVDILSLG